MRQGSALESHDMSSAWLHEYLAHDILYCDTKKILNSTGHTKLPKHHKNVMWGDQIIYIYEVKTFFLLKGNGVSPSIVL